MSDRAAYALAVALIAVALALWDGPHVVVADARGGVYVVSRYTGRAEWIAATDRFGVSDDAIEPEPDIEEEPAPLRGNWDILLPPDTSIDFIPVPPAQE